MDRGHSPTSANLRDICVLLVAVPIDRDAEICTVEVRSGT